VFALTLSIRLDTIQAAVRSASVLLVLGLLPLAAASASASDLNREQIRFNAADQAAARAATVRRSDLRPAGHWVGGMVKPNLTSTSSPRCANYHPNVSHFVLIDVSRPVRTGVAGSDWTRFPYGADLERSVSVQTEVLQTAQMVRREWRLQIDMPGFVPCLRRFFARWYVAVGGRLNSFQRVSFPRLVPHAAAYRIVGTIGPLEPDVTEFALLGKSRTEIDLSVFGPSSARTWVATQTVRLARILARRIRA
jgi:hypothetical protein